MSPAIPQQIRDMAENMGVDVEELAARLGLVDQPSTAVKVDAPVQDDANVRTVSTEDPLETQLALAQQELQQTRQQLQTAQSGRVVGSGGLDNSGAPVAIPNLGGIEPGIRYLVRNGILSAEDLEKRVGPAIVKLFEADLGGVI